MPVRQSLAIRWTNVADASGKNLLRSRGSPNHAGHMCHGTQYACWSHIGRFGLRAEEGSPDLQVKESSSMHQVPARLSTGRRRTALLLRHVWREDDLFNPAINRLLVGKPSIHPRTQGHKLVERGVSNVLEVSSIDLRMPVKLTEVDVYKC